MKPTIKALDALRGVLVFVEFHDHTKNSTDSVLAQVAGWLVSYTRRRGAIPSKVIINTWNLPDESIETRTANMEPITILRGDIINIIPLDIPAL